MPVTAAQHHDRADELAAAARRNLAARARCTDDFRDLGLMLGLIEAGPGGSFVPACPGDSGNDGATGDDPRRRAHPSLG